jgi:hypothetical protein
MQILLDTLESLLFVSQNQLQILELLPCFLVLLPYGFILLDKSIVLLRDEIKGILDPHEFIVLLLNKFSLALEFLLLPDLVLLERQLGQPYLVSNAFLHVQD